MKPDTLFLFLIASCLVLGACAPAPAAAPPAHTASPVAMVTNDPSPAAATIAPSPTPTATETPPPTPIPTETPSSTATQLPTATLFPTETPTDTVRSVPPVTSVPLVTPAPPPATATPAVAIIPVGNATAHEGQLVTVSGRVVEVSSFSQGFKFVLADESGRITLLLWHSVYDDCWDAPQLNIGATVSATGEVGQYEGEWQIAPRFGGDVQVTAAAGATAPLTNIGELGAHLEERVTIVGSILRVEGSGGGTKLFVGDESGEVVVFVWQNILDRIPDNTALGVPGTQVRVVGRVTLYRSNRQVVPALPYDVEVLP